MVKKLEESPFELKELPPEVEAQLPEFIRVLRKFYFSLPKQERDKLGKGNKNLDVPKQEGKAFKFCYECGQKINRTAKFCESCGTKQLN